MPPGTRSGIGLTGHAATFEFGFSGAPAQVLEDNRRRRLFCVPHKRIEVVIEILLILLVPVVASLVRWNGPKIPGFWLRGLFSYKTGLRVHDPSTLTLSQQRVQADEEYFYHNLYPLVGTQKAGRAPIVPPGPAPARR